MPETHPEGRFAFPAMLIGSICLAFGPWMVRLADTGPLAAGFWRMAIAAPLLLLLCPVTRQPLPRSGKGIIAAIFLAGTAFALDLASWHEGIVRTSLANSTLVGNATTFSFAAWGFWVARRWPDRNAAMTLTLALAGMTLLMSRSYELSLRNLTGDLLCLLAAGFYTIYLIAIGKLRGHLAPLPTLALATTAGMVPALIVALIGEGDIWPQDWTPLIGLALSSQLVGQGLVVYAVGHLEPIVVGLCLLVQPLVAGTIGWIIYDERLGLTGLMGALMIAAALVLIRRPANANGSPTSANPLNGLRD